MIRHIETPTITEIADVLSLTRDGSGGFNISTVSSAKIGYNDPTLYINRAVDAIVNSTVTNTLITNDGLIGIFRRTNKLEVIDIFEQDLTTYQELAPLGYAELASYDETINPVNKRLFIVRDKDGDNVLWTKNKLEFINTDHDRYYFSSLMDYDLPTSLTTDPTDTDNYDADHPDNYGFYVTTGALWESTYKETSNFQFLKKSFFKFEGTDAITLALKAEDASIYLEDTNFIAEGWIGLRYLDIGIDGINDTLEDKYINFTISSTTFDYGYIAVY